MKTLIPFLLLIFLTAVLPAAFRPQDIAVHKLENGLKVLLLEDHDIPNIAYYTLFRVGSRNERPGLTGVSHFIEHMMFNGTPGHRPGRVRPPHGVPGRCQQRLHRRRSDRHTATGIPARRPGADGASWRPTACRD